MNQQTCNLAWLDAFLKNDLNQSEEQILTSHLDECSDCREELENRAAEQSAWREASHLLGGSILLSTAAIGDLRSGTVRSPQIELVLRQLAPTDDPESLGRIGGYEVTGVVGAGGMGVVLKAHDRSLDRIVAIKVMSPHLASSGSARKRFAREAKAAAAVLHPNVIAIHSVASEDASPYLVMPYVRGASLQKRIDSQGPLPLKDTLRIGSQIAAGLAAAHEQGLVHRDIKPANILLEEGVERVTITDFGLARAVDDASMTCSGVIAGTPQYMSPEQTRGEPINARSDLFSLGSVLYAMCAGRSPFRAETTYGVLHRIANDNPTPVCEVNSDVPDWLGHIIERLMAKRAEDRFESAAQVAALLEGCLAHVQQPAAIPLPEAVAALAPKKTRRPPIGKFIAAAAGAFALFFAGILIVLELDKGTLTIESELDDVPIRIMQGEKVVKQLTVTKSGKSVRVAAGTYQIEIAGEFPLVSVANGIVSMKRGETETVTIAMTPPTTANTKREPVNSDLSSASTRLVADVIRQFNELQKSDPVGSKQPLLTDDEVIAAVRAMSREFASINVTESNYKVLRDTIERGQIPNEWTIESSNQFKLSDGRVGERWTVQLSLRRGESSPQSYVFRSRYVKIEPETSASKLPMPEGNVSLAEWLAKVNAPDPNIYAPLPDLPVTEQEIVAALTDLIDKDQSTEFAPQRKTLQEIIETRSLPKEAEISVFRPQRLRGYVSRWSNREGFENEDWTLRFEYPYTQDGKQIVTAVHLGFRSFNSRPVDHVTDDEIHWGPDAQDGLQFGVAIEEVTLPDKSDLASTGAMAYKPHFYFRNPGKTDSTSIQLSDMYQHYEIDARTATGEQLPSKRRQGYYWISLKSFPDPLNSESRIYKRASPFVVGTYVQTLFEDSLSLEPPDGHSFESFPSVAVNAPPNTPLRVRISIPHPLFSDSTRLLSGEIRLPPLKQTQTNTNTPEDEKAKDEAAKAWLRRPVVGSTLDGKSFQLAGHDALMHCVMTNNSESLKRLLAMDEYDLDFEPSNGQWTLLQTALQHNCVETTSLLLRHGANPNFAGKGTPSPLELAKRSGRKELVALMQKFLESVPPAIQTVQLDANAKDLLLRLKGEWKLDATSFDGRRLGETRSNVTLRLTDHSLAKFDGSRPLGPVYEITDMNAQTDPVEISLTRELKGQVGTLESLLSLENVVLTLATPIFPQYSRPQSLQPARGVNIERWKRINERTSEKGESTSIQKTVDALVTISFSGTIDGASIASSGIGWMVNDAGHILVPSHVVPGCNDEAIKLRYASGAHCSARRLKTLGHLTLLKSDQVVKGPAISLNSVTPLNTGDAASSILNGTDNIPGSISSARTTILISELEGVKINPELRFQNIITTDFVADDTTLSGAPLLTKSGDVAGMMIRFGSAQLIAIPVAEILASLEQLAAKDSAVTLPSMEFDTLEDFLKPGRELFDKEMKQIDERLATVVEGSAEHSLLTTRKKQLQQQWDLSVAQVKGMAAAAKAGKPVQLAPIVIPNNARPWQAPMPDPLSGHDEDIAKVLAGTWDIKRFVQDGEEPSLDGSTTVSFSKNMMISHFKVGDEEFEIQSMYRIGNDKIDIWHMVSGPDIRTALPYLGSYSIENDTLRICYHNRAMELETPQSRPPVQPGHGLIYWELQRAPRAEKVSVAKGETDDLRSGQSYKIKLLVLASDDLKPVSGATVVVTLIRTDSGFSGDGGFSDFKTNEVGIASIDNSLWPGRYQIQIRAPKDSRYRDTEFSKDESILIVHEDGRYSPREFRLVVDDKKPTK